jgi:putative ubiquitin-RnfH superfamily antitoxin RatB of RatAB toxin-antitoxin module
MAARPDVPTIEVVHARPERQRVVELPLAEGMTAMQAVQASGLLEEFALDPAALALGVYGRKVDGARPLRAGDRVEIYRPLAADPREARRRSVQLPGTGGRRRATRPG